MDWICQPLSEMTAADCERWFAAMSPDKRARVSHLANEIDRRRSVLADHLAKTLLSKASGQAIEKIVLSQTEKGRPYAPDLPFFVSLSHSGKFAAAAVSERPVGLDIQEMRPLRRGLIDRVCTAAEAAYVGDDPYRFYEIWTYKEAAYKLAGGKNPFSALSRFPEDDRLTITYALRENHLVCILTEK